jgi:uncharacterized membrane protein YvbJ
MSRESAKHPAGCLNHKKNIMKKSLLVIAIIATAVLFPTAIYLFNSMFF